MLANELIKPILHIKLTKFSNICTQLSKMSVQQNTHVRYDECIFVATKLFIFIKKNAIYSFYLQQTCSWYSYKFLHNKDFFNNYLNTDSFYFQVFIDKEQPRYLFLNSDSNVSNFFSTGFLLKLHNIIQKCIRRAPERHTPIILFFLRFIYKKILKIKGTFILTGYRRKYVHFITLLLNNLVCKCFSSVLIWPQLKMSLFFFRKVKAIKKRLKKNILKKQKKYLN